MNSSLLGAVGATLKSVGEKVGDASLSASLLSDFRSNFEETFEIRYCRTVTRVERVSRRFICFLFRLLRRSIQSKYAGPFDIENSFQPVISV